MRFSSRTEEEPQITLTPLIDVVFLLLIFFMVSTTFSKESELNIRLPEASVEPEVTDQDRLLQIEISSDSYFSVKGPGQRAGGLMHRPSIATLSNAIDKASSKRRDLIVLIRADRKTPHESVVRAMDVARRLGYLQLTVSTQHDPASQTTQ